MAAQRIKHQKEVLSTLAAHKPDLSTRYNLAALGIFGSFARNEARSASDIDIVVQTTLPDPFRLVCLKEELETLLGSRVDLVRYWRRMNPDLKKRIDQEAKYV